MKKEYRKVFMSWDNLEVGREDKYIRAIALCDMYGWFDEAINCVRDCQMGEKDSNGVYERIWHADYIENDCGRENVRPATIEEVELYLQYCPLGNDIKRIIYSYGCIEVVCRHNYKDILDKWGRKLLNLFGKGKHIYEDAE